MHDTPGAARRVATVAVLLAVTVIGLRTRGAFSRAADAAVAGVTGSVLAAVLAACEGVALVAFIIVAVAARRQRRKRDDTELEQLVFPWWAKPAGVLLAFAALATPFVVLLTRRTGQRTVPPPPLTHLTRPLTGSQPPNVTAHSSPWPLIAGMVIAIAALLTMTLLTRRGRRAGRPRDRVNRVDALAQGLAAGSAALQASREPRAAIIACYAAMERGFAAAGSVPAPADTPAEVLARATGAGIVRSVSAGVLTGLFRRARYSTEPMTSADSAAAATALAQMRADLTGPSDRCDPPGPHALAGAGARP